MGDLFSSVALKPADFNLSVFITRHGEPVYILVGWFQDKYKIMKSRPVVPLVSKSENMVNQDINCYIFVKITFLGVKTVKKFTVKMKNFLSIRAVSPFLIVLWETTIKTS